ncbi:MAG: hypothetical protein B6D44_00275 [Ignavibacteriales bacterium UTCHB2]|jgi:ABC-type bacteriocin/lantibiotic exporter with double-glycine peptidase domain|nr:MAG: hypothetical protein B6D44_00275 [Ignavibacteriales bacterium UTCHB2]
MNIIPVFNQYDDIVKTVIKFLKLLNVKVNSSTVNRELQNHPDGPSLLGITDSFNKWNIPNGVGKIDTSKIDELPTPFIAHINRRGGPILIVTDVSDKDIRVYNKDKIVVETREVFLKKWKGVYIIAEPNEHSGEANYEVNKRKVFLSSLIPAALFILIAILPFLFFPAVSRIGLYYQYFIFLAGLIITTLLLWYVIDSNNPLLQKVCTSSIIKKASCNAILTGKRAKVFS